MRLPSNSPTPSSKNSPATRSWKSRATTAAISNRFVAFSPARRDGSQGHPHRLYGHREKRGFARARQTPRMAPRRLRRAARTTCRETNFHHIQRKWRDPLPHARVRPDRRDYGRPAPMPSMRQPAAGEESKPLAALETVYERLVEAELGRSSPPFPLGGSVVAGLPA